MAHTFLVRCYHIGMSALRIGDKLFVRNLVFGVEDGLVSTVGLLSGIAMAGVDRETIFLTGVVLIFVEAFSMAAGSFLSEASVEEMDGGDDDTEGSVIAGAVMFFSYFIAGLVPLTPYLLTEIRLALPLSVVLSIAALFLLGYWSGRKTRSAWRKSVRMGAIGGLAILVGALAGTFVSL